MYLVHHQDLVPHEGITKYKVRVFKYFSVARSYCEENSVRVDKNGYNDMTNESRVEYVVYDNWATEFMWIEEVDVHERKDVEFNRLYGW